jgi:hypothetical protein
MGKLIVTKKYMFSKLGVDEIQGLKETLRKVMTPVRDVVEDRAYWTDVTLDDTEYKSRDGFIPYSHNCGGVEVSIIVPKCEEHDWSFLVFGECDGCNDDCSACAGSDPNGSGECIAESDGFYDAKLRVWLKFEGINDAGEMQFWLYMGGGNGDAPYFRTKAETTIFEASFSAKTLKQVETRGASAVKRLLKAME